jgi:hypothetical protein
MIAEFLFLGVLMILNYALYMSVKSIYFYLNGESKGLREHSKSWRKFDERQLRQNTVDRIRKEKELAKAERLIKRNKFEEAIDIYDIYGSKKLKESTLKKQAYVREEALDYNSAILIWEELGDIKEAARVRKKLAAQGSIKVAQKVVHGDEVTEIKDSILNRSNVGGKSSKAEELREAKSLFEEGLIDDDEFKQMKKEILGK